MAVHFFAADYSLSLLPVWQREWRRPWKLISFACGMAWLLYGATHYAIADWDIGISLIMGGLTYLLAPWAVFVIGSAIRYRPRYWWLHVVAAMLVAWFVIDLGYVLYHTWMGNMMFRDANAYASTPLFFICGFMWLYRGSLAQLWRETRDCLRAVPR